ncbi:MAG: hypothetical protein U0L20_01170 [Ruminococcus sp.]|nr:hypothetical protein [Ruminococcus sp.]
MTKTEDLLTDSLKDDQKNRFIDFSNAWSIINAESNLDSFITGFRLGANFTYDTFVATDNSFEYLLTAMLWFTLLKFRIYV